MDKAFFANCYLEFALGDLKEGLVAMISDSGALRVQFQGVPYSKISGLAGKTVEVVIAGKARVEGRLCKEVNLSGSFYRLQFENLSEEAQQVIRDALALQRYPAPWERKSERFAGDGAVAAKAQPAANVAERPRDAVVTHGQDLFDLVVIDFSRDGLLLEGRGEKFANWHAGERVELRLTTNHGNTLQGMHGAIVRITEDFDRELNEGIYRFGIQLATLDEFTRRRYHDLIERARNAQDDEETTDVTTSIARAA